VIASLHAPVQAGNSGMPSTKSGLNEVLPIAETDPGKP